MRPLFALLAAGALALAACGHRAAQPQGALESAAAPVVAAERAFAQAGQERPVREAFLAYVAADAVRVSPEGAGSAPAWIEGWPQRQDAGAITWGPAFAGVSRSGELGFTTGPALYQGGRRGTYLTLWRRQPDRAWRWVFDLGADEQAFAAKALKKAPRLAAFGSLVPLTPEAASAAAKRETAVLAGRLQALGGKGMREVATREAALAGWPEDAAVALEDLGGAAAQSGELAYRYGQARWAGEGGPKAGAFLILWRREADERWRVIAAVLSET